MTHDTGYKRLFAHPEMVRDLLRDWVPGEWLAEADFSTLERINASFVAENEKERHDDMVWRLRLRDRWLWVYLVLEFQSEVDRWMALRMLVYAGLLAQDLVKRGELVDGKQPPFCRSSSTTASRCGVRRLRWASSLPRRRLAWATISRISPII